MNLIDVTRTFQTDDDCLAYLETMRWPDGIRCPVCGHDRISKITRKTASKNKRTRIYQCLESTCKQQFSATAGTIFNDSHLPLTTWFMALAIVVDAKKSISAKQLQQHLGIGSYRTAWYMAHRIRKAMEAKTIFQMTGTVEIDETYVGGKIRGRQNKNKNKEMVLGMKERGGSLRLMHVTDIKAKTLASAIKENLSPEVEAIMTDEWTAYPKALIELGIHGSKHHTINHSAGIYVRGNVTTNGIESAFSLLKRGVYGQFHYVSIQHLHRYLSEFEYRFNARKAADRFSMTLAEMMGTKPMPYAALTAGE